MLGVVLWIAGLVIGSRADRPVAPVPQFADGYRVVAADLHVHAYPGDGALPPWELSHEAWRRRLDAVALTNHNQMLPVMLAAAVPVSQQALLIPGEEVTTPAYHMAAVGITQRVGWRSGVVDLASQVHAQGGAAIVAHPDHKVWRAFDSPAIRAIDGVEVAYPSMESRGADYRDYVVFHTLARAVKPRIAAIGSTDFHDLAPLGEYRTYLFVRDLSVAGIVEAIRDGRTVACDAHGVTYGDPDLVRHVTARCRADADWNPSGAADRAGVACALLGLSMIIVVGQRSES
jgi:hypothetical protein